MIDQEVLLHSFTKLSMNQDQKDKYQRLFEQKQKENPDFLHSTTLFLEKDELLHSIAYQKLQKLASSQLLAKIDEHSLNLIQRVNSFDQQVITEEVLSKLIAHVRERLHLSLEKEDLPGAVEDSL